MIIVAIDPGGTTGMAVIKTPIKVVRLEQGESLSDILLGALRHEPDEIVVEQFITYPTAGSFMGWQRTPAEMVGQIRAVAEHQGIPLVEQAPSQKHGALKLLKPLGLWKGGMPHAMDALAHAVYRSLYGHGYEKDPAVQAKLKRFLLESEV